MVKQIRLNFLEFLEGERDLGPLDVAEATGYSYESIKAFRNGNQVTLPIAMALVASYPVLGQDLACPHCGAMPFSWR